MSRPLILVAEDDPDLRQKLGKFLQKSGYAAICVEDGYQALEFALKDEPQLLLLDVHMPAGDGFSVHERIARHPELALAPVIYMTHEITSLIQQESEEHGAFALLQKPFEMEKLLEVVQGALNAAGSEAA